MDELIGVIKLFAGNFAPRGWMFCQGQILPIAQNTALFSLLGIQYGGNGSNTFALPDLRGRVPVGFGQGPGLSSVEIGETFGSDKVTLLLPNLPAHTHQGTLSNLQLPVNNEDGGADETSPVLGVLANSGSTSYASSSDAIHSYTGNLGGLQIGVTGSNTPFDISQPSLGLNYIICVEGIYPSRN